MEIGEPLLSERIRINSIETEATFYTGGQLCWSDGRLDFDKEVLGFFVDGLKINISTVVKRASKSTLVRKTLILELFSNESLSLWTRKLQDYLNSLGRPKSLFILVNPFGGKKSASRIFANDVRPLLEDANISYTMRETEYQLHAKELVKSLDLSKYDGLVCVSGDGILVEVVNGLLSREDWDYAIKMPIGVVPGGTGNGMVKSLLDSNNEPCTPLNATLAILRGCKRSLDVATISQGNTKFFSVLMLAWGLVADIDIESERYRWMGSARFDFYAVQRILCLRKYNGKIAFVPASGYENYGEPCGVANEIIIEVENEAKPDTQYGYLGPKVDVRSFNWRMIEGPFVSIWVQNVPWGNESSLAAPNAKFSDGHLDMIIIKDIPKLSLLKSMTELNTGSHIKSKHLSYIKVKSFILQPGSRIDNPGKAGIIDVDGEVLAKGKGAYTNVEETLMNYDKIIVKLDQGLATLFSPN